MERGGAEGQAPRLVLVAGTTETARIDGISAAGADPAAMAHTPAADAEVLTYGHTVRAPHVPVSPTGCPTPAVVTRAVRELLGFPVTVVDGGLAEPTGAPTVTLGARPGADIRDPDPVPAARDVFETARAFGRALPDDEVLLAETVPGGTTTARGVLRALGEDLPVSSSLRENPRALKEEVVADALAASSLEPGDAAEDPAVALRRVGDPVLATLGGLVTGLTTADADVTLAGGTQMLAVAALARHAGVTEPLPLATTRFVADDVPLRDAAGALDVAVTTTDPDFADTDHPGMVAYEAGEAKEGVGMGGALALAAEAGLPTARVHERVRRVYDRLVGDSAPAMP